MSNYRPLIAELSIFLLSSSILLAQGPTVTTKKNPISLLPDGSVLKGVLIPRYDKNRRLVGDLKAETMTLIDENRIQGENVLIKFYEDGRNARGQVHLQNALFNEAESLIYANENVEFTNDRLFARGTGFVYAFKTGEGFLKGPTSTRISNPVPPETSMRSQAPFYDSPIPPANHSPVPPANHFPSSDPTNPPQIVQLPTFIALCLAPTITLAAPPAYVSEAELAEIKEESTSGKAQFQTLNKQTGIALNEDIATSKKTSEVANQFAEVSKLKLVSKKNQNKEKQPAPEASPLAVNPSPQDTIISCDDGMYFDADEGVLVYLGNVRVKDPRFTLSGADELKVFFEKKESNPSAEGNTSGPSANFGDVQKLIATGTVRLLQKSVNGKEPIEASGGLLTYDIPTGEIIISQRFPWVKQGSFYARAKQANLTLRLLNDGSFSTQGNWEMGGKLSPDNN